MSKWSFLKAGKAFFKSNWGKSLMGGAGAFFGFEWLSSGGLVSSTSSALGISDTASTLLIVAVIAGVLYIVIKVVSSKVGAKR